MKQLVALEEESVKADKLCSLKWCITLQLDLFADRVKQDGEQAVVTGLIIKPTRCTNFSNLFL